MLNTYKLFQYVLVWSAYSYDNSLFYLFKRNLKEKHGLQYLGISRWKC